MYNKCTTLIKVVMHKKLGSSGEIELSLVLWAHLLSKSQDLIIDYK